MKRNPSGNQPSHQHSLPLASHAPTQGDDSPQDTRRAILDAAVSLFSEHGHHNFSLRQVAREIGYTPTTIYLYFEDKDDLLYHVTMEAYKHFGDGLQARYMDASDPLDRFLGICKAYVRFGLENPFHYRIMFIDRVDFLQRTPPAGMEKPLDSFALLVQSIDECIRAGLFRLGDPEILAATVWATVHGIVTVATVTPYLDEHQTTLVEEAAYEMIQIGLRRR